MPHVLSAMQRQWKTFVKTDGSASPPPLNTNGKFKVQLMAGEPRNIWRFSLTLNIPQRIHYYNSGTSWLWPNSEYCKNSHFIVYTFSQNEELLRCTKTKMQQLTWFSVFLKRHVRQLVQSSRTIFAQCFMVVYNAIQLLFIY